MTDTDIMEEPECHKRIGGSAFQTPYLAHIIKKVKQERDTGQEQRKMWKILKHGKNT
jgi:hypothetical protein